MDDHLDKILNTLYYHIYLANNFLLENFLNLQEFQLMDNLLNFLLYILLHILHYYDLLGFCKYCIHYNYNLYIFFQIQKGISYSKYYHLLINDIPLHNQIYILHHYIYDRDECYFLYHNSLNNDHQKKIYKK